MKQPTEAEIERGVAALIPYVQEWGLPLNPEDLQAMAVAVLIHTYSDETFDEIDAAERERIKDDREAHRRMVAAMAEALEKRRGPEPRLPRSPERLEDAEDQQQDQRQRDGDE